MSTTSAPAQTLADLPPTDVLLELLGVSKEFRVRHEGRRATLSAVDDVHLQVREGTTLGIVGESGCGKSTLGRVIVGLHQETDGELLFADKQLKGRRSRSELQQMQMVFQDPASALNPRATVGESIAFPLRVLRLSPDEVDERVADVIAAVGLPAAYAGHYPHQLSGGQRQRVNIARALAVHARLIVLDEAVSARAKSIQAQVLNLLTDLQEQYGLTYVFISHDLNVVEYVSDDVVVMYLGQVVERAPAAALYEQPLHPYTQLLLGSVPHLDPRLSRRDDPAPTHEADIPSPIDPPSGCRFRTRCPHAAEVCAQERPAAVTTGPDHVVACHLYTPGSPVPLGTPAVRAAS